jgi:hypothetical protein
MEVLDVVTESPLQGGQKWFDSDERNINVASEDGVLSPGEEFVRRVFQRVQPPPRATSLEPYTNSQLPLFTSTPKSRPLKSLLPRTVNKPSLDTRLISGKTPNLVSNA